MNLPFALRSKLRCLGLTLPMAIIAFAPMGYADCLMKPERPCVELKFMKIKQVGPQKSCLGDVSVQPDKFPETVFFQNCPAPSSILHCNLFQRADITLEGMAQCQYECRVLPSCSDMKKK